MRTARVGPGAGRVEEAGGVGNARAAVGCMALRSPPAMGRGEVAGALGVTGGAVRRVARRMGSAGNLDWFVTAVVQEGGVWHWHWHYCQWRGPTVAGVQVQRLARVVCVNMHTCIYGGKAWCGWCRSS